MWTRLNQIIIYITYMYWIQKHSLSSGVTIIFSVAGPTLTVSATTLHLYVLNGLIRAVTLIVFVVGKMLVI